jgi:hypothetical protein
MLSINSLRRRDTSNLEKGQATIIDETPGPEFAFPPSHTVDRIFITCLRFAYLCASVVWGVMWATNGPRICSDRWVVPAISLWVGVELLYRWCRKFEERERKGKDERFEV